MGVRHTADGKRLKRKNRIREFHCSYFILCSTGKNIAHDSIPKGIIFMSNTFSAYNLFFQIKTLNCFLFFGFDDPPDETLAIRLYLSLVIYFARITSDRKIMNIDPKMIMGNWTHGWALDRHTLHSTSGGSETACILNSTPNGPKWVRRYTG